MVLERTVGQIQHATLDSDVTIVALKLSIATDHLVMAYLWRIATYMHAAFINDVSPSHSAPQTQPLDICYAFYLATARQRRSRWKHAMPTT